MSDTSTDTESTAGGRRGIAAPLERVLGDGGVTKGLWAWTVLRLLLGWAFIWAFVDKMFGLGFATCRAEDSSSIDYLCDAAMIKGGSPTYGVLHFGTQGSHAGFLFDWMSSPSATTIGIADIGFMMAMLLGGAALMLGIGVRIAAICSAILMVFMFLALDVWPDQNPINSSHVIEMVAYLGIATVGAGRFALQPWFDRTFPRIARWAR